MEVVQFSIQISAEVKKVWDTMLNDPTYREWTKEFNPGSYYEGTWEKGSEIRFLGADKQGQLQGMFSKIKENKKYEFISIEHLGLIVNGKVDTKSDEVKKWAPAFENYSFVKTGDITELKVEMQVDEEYQAMFEDMWPRALKSLKKLCES